MLLQKMGMIQFRAGNLESSRVYLQKAVDIYHKGGDASASYVVTPLFVIGNIEKLLERADEANRSDRSLRNEQ